MHRRSVLVGSAALLSVVTGCLEDDENGPDDGASESADADGTTEIEDVDVDFDADVDRSTSFRDDPDVRVRDDEVRVTGRYSTGSGCYDEHLAEPTYDDAEDEVRIALEREYNGNDDCDDVEQMVSYEVVVTIDGSPPGTVVVTEDVGGETTVEAWRSSGRGADVA